MNPDPARWTEAERSQFYARRTSRNRALGVLLFTLVALFFGITVVRMADQLNAVPAPPSSATPRFPAARQLPAAQ